MRGMLTLAVRVLGIVESPARDQDAADELYTTLVSRRWVIWRAWPQAGKVQ